VSGSDSDAFGDTGVWSYTLIIDAVTITQGGPTSGTTTTTGSSSFADQLTTTGQNGAVSFVATYDPCGVLVSGSGAISTSGTLPAGSCTISGTDPDAFGDTGVWTYTLTIDAVTITQAAPTSSTTTTTGSSTFADQLITTAQNSAVSFLTTSVSCGFSSRPPAPSARPAHWRPAAARSRTRSVTPGSGVHPHDHRRRPRPGSAYDRHHDDDALGGLHRPARHERPGRARQLRHDL
jgi:hypothetical protein